MGQVQVVESRNRASDGQVPHEAPLGDEDARREIEHLQRALVTRTVIGQAMGILMERYKITSDQAFDQLKTVSQQANVRLAELAQDLTESGEWPPPGVGRVNGSASAPTHATSR